MYLLIELFSSLMAHLGRASVPAKPDATAAGYHVSPDAILS